MNPTQWLQAYATTVRAAGGDTSVMANYLLDMLTPPAMSWFTSLAPDSIRSYVPGRGVRLIHGEPDGPQINSAFSSSISWRSMPVDDDDSSLATLAPATADPISEPHLRSSSPTTHRPLGARHQRRLDNAIRRRPDFLSKAKSHFNILLNILQSPYIAIMFF